MTVEQDIRQEISEPLCRSFGIKLVYLFGSAARSGASYNDIDLAILIDAEEPNQEKELETAEALRAFLAKTQDRGVPFQVTPLNSANPLLRFEAIKEGKCLFSRSEEDRISFELKVLREYGDYKAKSRFYEQALRDRLKKKPA